MSQELTEKVALACFEADLEWFAARNPDVPIEELRQHAKDDLATNYAAIARAALAVVLEAMADPTPSMIAAAWAKIAPAKQAAGIARLGPGPGASEFWRAMLSASPLGEQ